MSFSSVSFHGPEAFFCWLGILHVKNDPILQFQPNVDSFVACFSEIGSFGKLVSGRRECWEEIRTGSAIGRETCEDQVAGRSLFVVEHLQAQYVGTC